MSDDDASALVEQVVSAYGRTNDPRWNEIVSSLIRHLHGFAHEVRLTPQDWMSAIQFLTRTGQACVGPRQEFILLSDALGLSSAVDDVNNGASGGGTQSALLGPFYAPGSPEIANGESIALSGEGERLLVRGRVLDTSGRPIPGATLDIWHTAPNQLYAVQDSAQPEMNFRAKLAADARGCYEFRSIKPIAYPAPTDGPVGVLLEKAGRHPMRPAHIHFIVSAEGHRSVTTQVFTRDDPYVGSDAVFGVKPALLADYQRISDPGLDCDWLLEWDFALEPTLGSALE